MPKETYNSQESSLNSINAWKHGNDEYLAAMMKLYPHFAHYWDAVYEWEDIFLKNKKFSLLFDKWPSSDEVIVIRNLNRVLKFFGNYKKFNIEPGNNNLAFIMRPNESYRYKSYSTIPIYLDVSETDFEHIIFETQKLPVYFVTALETCTRLRELSKDNRCEYISLSVSDIYK